MMQFKNSVRNNLWYCFLVFFVVMMLMVTGCGKIGIIKNVEPEFDQLITQFYDLKRLSYNTPIVARFADINKKGANGGNVIGECDPSSNPPEITIDYKSWVKFSDNQKLALMFHELGHCLLIKVHNDNKLEDGCAASIMNSYLPSDYCLDNHLQEYLDNL